MAETTVSERMTTRPVGHADTLGARMTALRHGMSPWWFLLPAVLFFVGYQAYPIFRVLWISFTDYQYLSSEPAHFVGFNNYVAALKDPLMWSSLWRATMFTIMFLPGTIILPLLLAILVDKVSNPRLATLYRVVLLIPAVIPSTLVFVLWKWMYNYQVGPINHLLVDVFGLFTLQNAPQWLGGTSLTLPAIAVYEWVEDTVVIGESMIVSGAMVEIAKIAFQRPRPQAYGLAPDDPKVTFPDTYQSFYSLAADSNTGDGILAGERVSGQIDRKLESPALWMPSSVMKQPDGHAASLAASTAIRRPIPGPCSCMTRPSSLAYGARASLPPSA